MAKQVKSRAASGGSRRPATKAPPHPGEVLLRDHLERLGMSQRALARACRVRVSYLNNVLREKTVVSSDLALRLGKVLRTTPNYWLDLQRAWDFWRVMRSAEGAVIARLEPIRAGDRDRLGQPQRSPRKARGVKAKRRGQWKT
jgi:antitoxin HigA-1